MKPKHHRLTLTLISIFCGACGLYLLLTAFQENLLFFYSPSELLEKPLAAKKVRLGGVVKPSSVYYDKTIVHFIVTDFKKERRVSFNGIPPNLFSEGKGIIAEGNLDKQGTFIASKLLAKHDETYRPPKSLKGKST